MIKQFFANVDWGTLDYLVVDTPPGTSDEHISLAEMLSAHQSVRAVMVTTPQLIAISDVEREIGFCRQVGIPIKGVIENMSGYLCPHCKDCTNVFSSEGGENLAGKHSLPFLGRVPISPKFNRLVEADSANIIRDYPSQCPELHELFKGMIINL